MNPDLFTPHDVAVLLAIRAAQAGRRLSAAELLALFGAEGLLREPDVAPARAPFTGVPAHRASVQP